MYANPIFFIFFILFVSDCGRGRSMPMVVSHKSAKTQSNKKIMRSGSVVLPHYFLAFAFETSLCKCICTSASFHLKLIPAALFSVNLNKFNPAFYALLSTPCKMTRNARARNNHRTINNAVASTRVLKRGVKLTRVICRV